MMPMFTKKEALDFVKDKLKVVDVENRLRSDRKLLLNDVVVNVQTEIVFQNLRLLSLPLNQRHKPTIGEIKSDMLSGVGGLCYNLNVATYFLLQALGYNVTLAHATCTSTVLYPNNHIIVYVHDVTVPGDKFLVEVGFGFPTYRIINLDFETETPVYVDSFIEYKYVKHEGQILRMHRQGDPVRAAALVKPNPVVDFYIDEFRRFYMAEEEGTTDLEVFHEYFHGVWTNPKGSPFHMSFRVIGFPQRKAVMVVNQRLLIENDKGHLEATEIEGGAEGVVTTVIRLFPVLPEKLVRDAMVQYREAVTQA